MIGLEAKKCVCTVAKELVRWSACVRWPRSRCDGVRVMIACVAELESEAVVHI